MKKIYLLSAGIITLCLVVILGLRFTKKIDPYAEYMYSKKNERPKLLPDEIEDIIDFDQLSGKEKKEHIAYINKLENSHNDINSLFPDKAKLKSEQLAEIGVYANGKVSGSWSQLIPHTTGKTKTTGKGFRVDNSAYDPETDIFYVVPYSTHLWKLDRTTDEKWFLLNNKITLNRIFDGLNMPDGSFRLIRSHKESNTLGYMMYSDDEGKSWSKANGALFFNNWAFNSVIVEHAGHPRIIILGAASATIDGTVQDAAKVYYSDDYGVTYTDAGIALPKADYKFHEDCKPHLGKNIKLVKVHNSNDVYLFARPNSTQKVGVYQFNNTTGSFDLLSESNDVYANALYQVEGTKVENETHFYGVFIDNIKYSIDMGITWQQQSTDGRKMESIHPTKANMIFKGGTDLSISDDYGKTFTEYKHEFGWDTQHMRFYQKKGGNWFAVVGNDHGFYTSDTPEDKLSYDWHNNRMPFGMHYDMDYSEVCNTTFVANQDRGLGGYLDTAQHVNYLKIEGTDVLRTAVANEGKSVWFRFYYGQIMHKHNFTLGDTRKASKGGYPNWVAPPLVASIAIGEDAVYTAGFGKLKKLTYNSSNNSVTETILPYDFNINHGAIISGIGFNQHDPNKWYVATKNGKFLYSNDAGTTWTESQTTVLPKADGTYYKRWHTIKVSPNDPDKIYLTGTDRRFMVSENGGQTFTSMGTGLDPIWKFMDFEVTPNEAFIFGVAEGMGAWVYVKADDTWYHLTGGIVPNNVKWTGVKYLKNKRTVRFSTYGAGVLDYKLDESMIVDNNTTAVSTITSQELKIFPNPATDILNIKMEKGIEQAQINVYNMNGKLVFNEPYTDQNQINISDLAIGMYILMIKNKTNNQTVTAKFSKQ